MRRSSPKVTGSRAAARSIPAGSEGLHRSRLSTTSARPRECPRAGSSGRLQRPGNTQRSGPNPPGGREVPAGWHTVGRASLGPEGGQVSVPQPPLTPRPRRARSSERPGPPRLTRLAATPESGSGIHRRRLCTQKPAARAPEPEQLRVAKVPRPPRLTPRGQPDQSGSFLNLSVYNNYLGRLLKCRF